jgi:hypothetical protein
MRTFVKYALRGLVVVVAAGLVLSLLGTPSPARTPYLSALSGFAVGQVYAAAYCNNKACVGGSRYNISCGNVDNYHCAKYGRGLCSNNPC